MIEVGSSYDPLLKRPFSFFRKTSDGIQFLYTIRGKGTRMMKSLKEGTVINVLGPLGRGYPEPEGNMVPLLVAGGIGIASIFPLVEMFAKKAHVLYGARDKDSLLMLDELKGLAAELVISTDDGSIGEKGTIVDVLDRFPASYLIYACGPKPMLMALSKIALKKNIRCYVSVEENMACGIGVCLGCAIKVKSQNTPNPGITYKSVCREGPVFSIEKIVWT